MSKTFSVLRKLFLNQGQKSVIYCFDIETIDKHTMHLTSCSKDIECAGLVYSKFSGLTIEHAEFTDFGGDEVRLSGIFEQGGITKTTNILDAKIRISLYIFENSQYILRNLVILKCNNIIMRDLDFVLTLHPETIKYEKSVVKIFSKLCRANFLDKNCGVQASEVTRHTRVEIVDNMRISCDLKENDHDYFIGGFAIFNADNQIFKYRIISTEIRHKEQEGAVTIFVLEQHIDKNCRTLNYINLIPACDKNFLTCCKKFNNAVNFRGEPFLPESGVLKN